MDFRLPQLGEGIDAATVVGVLVKPGDAVSAGQNVLAVETDKAAVEVPIDTAGTVGEIRVKPGDKIPVGGLVFTMNGEAPKASGERKLPDSPPATLPKTESKTESGGSRPPLASVAFKLPDLGEGIDAATVVGVLVKVGDAISANQNVISAETDKAAFEVPIDFAGTVMEIKVKTGDKIPIGAEVLVLQTSGSRQEAEKATPTPIQASPPKAPTPSSALSREPPAKQPLAKANDLTPAGPATRRLARELGVGLGEIKGSGRGGRVTLDDVKAFIREERGRARQGGGLSGKTVAESFAHPPLPDFGKYGEVERKAVSGLRKKIAENLTIVVRTIPAVTQNDLADITELEAGRKRVVEEQPKGSPKITWTVLAVKACVAALKEFPHFNSSLDMNAGELILKKYFHIGIAVDTERGLVVPVIKNADGKSLREIAGEVAGLAEKARAGKLSLEEMRGGTFTITNLGGIGGTSFTPIINYPEVAILGLSKSAWQPAVRDGKIEPRLMLPLSLTYDHRVIDGADGARFAARLTQLFSDPMRLLMET
jgi:pyruvate dehydrogenase E2 component (dihydrolipoamide acetyltransferase)